MPDNELAMAVEALYAAFARYERLPWFVACACCWDGEPIADEPGAVRAPAPGGRRPLRQVEPAELEQLATDATAGDDARPHYVPRILELVAADAFDDPGVVLERLAAAPGRPAICQFLDAWWDDVLTRSPGDDRAGKALDAIERLDPDVGAKLQRWAAFSHPNAAGHLVDFVASRARALALGKMTGPVADWLRSQSLRAAVAAAADRARTPEERAGLEECWLRWLS